ncbi:14-3-3 superfamily protein [Besnoitia besnoiti]|uniref:14-3-3 superfamily protein n=1 Tax=Besnoitia besnoiti TaxID=94643 RepID=A0A2A9MHY7_BESBE|nr:14-3-3 superfamily protein [Besnoitia besnoiti]PFH35012.1 14-3-3 superfamily protein [Besnoitia besnoiti]
MEEILRSIPSAIAGPAEMLLTAVTLSPRLAAGQTSMAPPGRRFNTLAKKEIHEMALRMMKGVGTESQSHRQRDRREDHSTPRVSSEERREKEKVAAATGFRLDDVLAFRKLVRATMNATLASASLREKDPVLAETTLAMGIFSIPRDAQRRITDTDRWRRLFPSARGERPTEVLTLLFLALMAEACRRFDEADVYIIQLLVCKATRHEELAPEERRCVQRAFNRRLQRSKNSWKHVLALEKALEVRASSSHGNRAFQMTELSAYKARLKDEIVRHCYSIVWAVTHLIMALPWSTDTRLFSHKCIATAFRQVTQFTDSMPQYQCLQLAKANYKRAIDIAKTDPSVGTCDMLRIETLISWANFLFYNLEKRGEALDSARQTLQECTGKLDTVPEEHYGEVVEALQTLMKTIRRWSQETRKDAVYDWWAST